MQNWNARVALVTGASAGIGLAVTERLLAQGARVALVARDARRLDDVVARLGARARAFAVDVTDLEAMRTLPGRVVDAFGGLDILVNNAGFNARGAFMDASPDALATIITTNLTAPIFLTRVCAEVLRPGGAIVNIASIAGMVPVHHEAAYSASKAGLRAFARVLHDELRDRRIAVSTVSPGPVDTGFLGDLREVPDLVLSQPMSTADDVAQAVMRALAGGGGEIALPALSGHLATVGYLSPTFLRVLRPAFERMGHMRKARLLARRGAH